MEAKAGQTNSWCKRIEEFSILLLMVFVIRHHHHMPDFVYNYSRIYIAQILQPGRNLFFSLKENDSNRNRKHQRSSFFFHLNLLLWAYDFNNSLRLNENSSFPLTFESEQRVCLPFSILCSVKHQTYTHIAHHKHMFHAISMKKWEIFEFSYSFVKAIDCFDFLFRKAFNVRSESCINKNGILFDVLSWQIQKGSI